ncbi:ATP-binding protein [Streptomyces sp. SID5914]|nr:ATP-binding protein [Streptomyces sp. SID5914]MZG18553.1 ATP-binding protein [Streptomyces sp. SID5914]
MTARPALGATSCVVWRWTSCTPDAPAQARAALRCALDQFGFDGEVISDAVLAVSEFVTNASQHAVGPYEMRLRRTAAEVICEVEDHDPRIPEVPAFPDTAPFDPVEENRGGGLEALCTQLSESGRGLHIVHELTKGAWGFRSRKGTKTAWFALPTELPPVLHGAGAAEGANTRRGDRS